MKMWTLYLKHIIWDCQREKAKKDALQNLGGKDIFWIKNWLQKSSQENLESLSKIILVKKEWVSMLMLFMKKDKNLHKCLLYPFAKMWPKHSTNIVSNGACLQLNQSRFSQ